MKKGSKVDDLFRIVFQLQRPDKTVSRMGGKKVSQEALRQMMQKMKAEKGDGGGAKRKYKLSSKELALLEQEKKRKLDERASEKKEQAKKAGVPENFFDSAKTKAFLNLNKAPQKSILKNSSKPASRTVDDQVKATPSGGANAKASGKEWTSKAPALTVQPKQKEAAKEEIPSDFFDSSKDDKPVKEQEVVAEDGGDELPEGFFDDPLKDAKARGVEYKVWIYFE